MSLFQHYLDLFLPPRCLVCGACIKDATRRVCFLCRPRREESCLRVGGPDRCRRCFSESSTSPCSICLLHPLPFGEMRYLFSYQGRIRDVICCWKYRPQSKLLDCINESISDFIPALKLPYKNYTTITSVPSSQKSVNERGFAPGAELAKIIAKLIQTEDRYQEFLLPSPHKRPQASLPIKQRLKQGPKLFKIEADFKFDLEGQEILLIDDVLTTGSSAVNCAKLLLNAGARKVDLLTLARAPAFESSRRFLSQAEPEKNNQTGSKIASGSS